MKKLVICVLLLAAIGLNAQTVSCPATRDGQKLTTAASFTMMAKGAAVVKVSCK